jgi:hypothetical protein
MLIPLVLLTAAAAAADVPARVVLDATRNVITYSTAIEAPNVSVNNSAELAIMRAELENASSELHALHSIVRTLQTLANECVSSPCMNGGTCFDGLMSFACVCPPGFSGTRCESDVNECTSSPCHNGGTCTNGVARFTCTCPEGFSGTSCEQSLWIVRYPQESVCDGVWSFVAGKGCHKASTAGGCATKVFSAGGRAFTQVRGRLTVFQQGSTDAFIHTDAISIWTTTGVHVWTYAVGLIKFSPQQCSCSSVACGERCPDNGGTAPPASIGSSYYCESGNNQCAWD